MEYWSCCFAQAAPSSYHWPWVPEPFNLLIHRDTLRRPGGPTLSAFLCFMNHHKIRFILHCRKKKKSTFNSSCVSNVINIPSIQYIHLFAKVRIRSASPEPTTKKIIPLVTSQPSGPSFWSASELGSAWLGDTSASSACHTGLCHQGFGGLGMGCHGDINSAKHLVLPALFGGHLQMCWKRGKKKKREFFLHHG